jgi:hypothetical protein
MHENIHHLGSLSNTSKNQTRRIKIKRRVRSKLEVTYFCPIIILKTVKSLKKTSKKNAIQK